MPDFLVQDEGNVFLLQPVSEEARQWLQDNLYKSGTGCAVIEYRFIVPVIGILQNEGFGIESEVSQ